MWRVTLSLPPYIETQLDISSRRRDERSIEYYEAAGSGGRIRCHPHRPRLAQQDQFVVLRRGEEAGYHQLPHLQARARRSGLLEVIRAREGLRLSVRLVQAPQAPRRDLLKVRCGSDSGQSASR